MGTKSQKKRDKEITREIHRLFWKAYFQDKWGVPICLLTRIPAFTLIHVFMPLSLAYGLEAVINGNFEQVNGYAWQLIFISIGFAVFWLIGGLFIARNGVISGGYLLRAVFANYLDKDYDFYSNTYFGSLGAQALRLREAGTNEYNIIMLLAIPKQLVIVLGGIIVIAFYSPALAFITFLTMTMVLSFTILSSRWRLKWRRRVSEETSNLAGKIGDALTHATTVKSFATEDFEEKSLNKPIRAWQHAQRVSWSLAMPTDVGRYILVAVTTAILLVMTAGLYRDGEISIAIVTLIQLYVIKLIAATVDINEIIKSYESAMGGAYQPVKTMLVERAVTDTDRPEKLPKLKQYAIDFDKVTFNYENTNGTAVKDFDLHISAGEKVGLVGYSGSGKTTLTKLLLRFMDVSDGSIDVAGMNIRSVAQRDLRKHIAYVPQEPLLFHRTIFENISYGRPEAGTEDIKRATQMAYVNEFLHELPEGFDTLVGERGVKLSGGQRQRVAIARAILKDAPILVLDEATSALDSRSEQLIQKALWQLMKDRTALVIAHRLSTIQRMDRIVVMDKGRVVQVGTHHELLKDGKGIYAELWSHQSGGYIGLPAEGGKE